MIVPALSKVALEHTDRMARRMGAEFVAPDAPTTPVNQGEAEILRERAQIVAWLSKDADLTEAESRKIISDSHGLKPRDIEDWRNLVATKRGIAAAIECGQHLTAFLQPLASPQ